MSAALPLPWCAALVAVVFAVGTAAGGYVGRAPLRAELANTRADMAELRSTHAEAARLAALAAAKGLQQAQARGDALTHTLARRQEQIDQLHKDKRDALKRLTTGRACLSADAVRLLNTANSTEPARPEPVSTPPGGVAAAGAAFATDADVGQWAIAAHAQYSECSGRLAALIDWHTISREVANGNVAD